jgi:CRP-like cAMP-binding protein
MVGPSILVRNHILAAMAPELFARLRPHLQQIALKHGAILQEHNRPIEHIYFIERGVASLFARTQRDGPVEVAIVGRLGFVGVAAVLGSMRSPNRCLMEVAGEALRISSRELQLTMDAAPSIRRHLLAYIHALLVQNTQTALCNVRHELEERLCRWLLLASDRLDETLIPVTHERLSMILGVRRAGVTVALSRLEDDHAIIKTRGAIKIANRAILEQKTCQCYRIIASEYKRIGNSGFYQHCITEKALSTVGRETKSKKSKIRGWTVKYGNTSRLRVPCEQPPGATE